MGGSGGGGGSGGIGGAPSAVGPAKAVPPRNTPMAAELVDKEITATLGEARRVEQLLDALKTAKEGDFMMCALNAGQGDCCVLRLPDGEIVVVDCNVRSANVNLVGFLEKAGIRTVDLLILTHPDQDHVSGLPGLVGAIKIKRVLDGRFRKEGEEGERTAGYQEYRQALDQLRASGTEFLPRTPVAGDQVDFGFAHIKFLAPRAPMQATEANEASLAFKATFKGRSILFGGDVTKDKWAEIVRRGKAGLKSDIFWSSHHGADSGCLPRAVKAIAPKITVVSVGENVYGHPHDSAMKCYAKHSGTVRRTDDGSIGIVSRGGQQWETIV